MLVPSIHFVQRRLSSQWPELWKTAERDLDQQPERFTGGETAWILQTYLRVENQLREAGFRITISDRLQAGAVNVAHRDALNRWFVPYLAHYIACVQADRPPAMVCNWSLVQNGLSGTSAARTEVNFWPQRGLIPRDQSRGGGLHRAAYFGRLGTTSPWLASPSFEASLNRLGMAFSVDSPAWHDYSQVDLFIAHRQEAPCMLVHKPASKLVNAWLAGVPALLNDEPAYRELRRSELDYFIIDSPEDAIQAITRLRVQPMLYEAMVANGRKRAEQYSVAATRDRWVRCLCDEIVPDAERHFALGRRHFRPLDQMSLLLRQKLADRRFRDTYRSQIAEILGARSASPTSDSS